jgi:hypothetical protein
MAEFFSTGIWAQRVRELEGSSKRDSDELAQVAMLLSHAEKRSQWLQRQYRSQQARSANSRQRLGLAQCNLVGARMREYVLDWVKSHDRATSSLEDFELNLALLVGEMLEVVEGLLKPSEVATSEPVDGLPARCGGPLGEPAADADSAPGS